MSSGKLSITEHIAHKTRFAEKNRKILNSIFPLVKFRIQDREQVKQARQAISIFYSWTVKFLSKCINSIFAVAMTRTAMMSTFVKKVMQDFNERNIRLHRKSSTEMNRIGKTDLLTFFYYNFFNDRADFELLKLSTMEILTYLMLREIHKT